jgi:hypothetical protein
MQSGETSQYQSIWLASALVELLRVPPMGFSIKPARTMFDFWTALEPCCDCGNVKLSAQVLPKSLTMALPTITPELAGQMVDKAGNSTLHQGVCALHHKQRSCNQSFFLSLSGPQTQELPLQLVPPNSELYIIIIFG